MNSDIYRGLLRPISALFLSLALVSAPLWGGERPGNNFVCAVVRHEGLWDPYGDLWPEIASYLRRTTSLTPWPERRVVSWRDAGFLESPFLVLTGRGSVPMSEEDAARLRDYLTGGGFLLVDNAEADQGGPFARSVAGLPGRLFPDAAWREVPADHAVFRSFFLLKGAAGRRKAEGGLKGLWVGERLAAVYAAGDLHGPWVRAPAGGWLFPCEPGGEPQRAEAQKLLVNIIMFSVTGTYKTDAVHQEFIQRKLEEP